MSNPGNRFKISTADGTPAQVVFSPDGSRIATFGSRVLQIWDGKNGEMIRAAPKQML